MVVPFPEGTPRRTRERTAGLAGAPELTGFQAELHLDAAGLVKTQVAGAPPEEGSAWAPFLPRFSETHLGEDAQPPGTF